MNKETKRMNLVQQQRNKEENLGGTRVLLRGKRVDDSSFLTFQNLLPINKITMHIYPYLYKTSFYIIKTDFNLL